MGTTEILIIAAIVLVLFGGAAIPKFARSLGRARKEFSEGIAEGETEGDKTKPEKKDGTKDEKKDAKKVAKKEE
ncbi:MAG: twin-arginine translocase TatA/TatE family subunit [Rectinemataceae bacterium]